MTLQEQVEQWREETADLDPGALITWAWRQFSDEVVLASSLGAEDQVLTHLIAHHAPQLAIITLDTGRLFGETHDLLNQTRRQYDVNLRVFFPEAGEVEAMVHEHGTNLFRESVALRKKCCAIRKVNPLKRALAGKKAWITGLRRDQSLNRNEIAAIEWDAGNQLVKINPLANWHDQQVRDYLRTHKVPYNPLHDRGFPSIGCAPCTRAVAPDEDPRAGRWWWEPREQSECGIHIVNGKVTRRVPVLVE